MCSWCDSQEVIAMADGVRTGRHLSILDTDGRPHPLEDAMTIFVLLAGLVSFVLGLVIRNVHTGPAGHITATATGLAALLVGLYAQMVSNTRNQRVLIVAGIIAGFVGLAIGLSQGGFTG
jgi:FtsH-binding integral membrane protein